MMISGLSRCGRNNSQLAFIAALIRKANKVGSARFWRGCPQCHAVRPIHFMTQRLQLLGAEFTSHLQLQISSRLLISTRVTCTCSSDQLSYLHGTNGGPHVATYSSSARKVRPLRLVSFIFRDIRSYRNKRIDFAQHSIRA